jgi:hypothetical protein
MVNQFFKFFWSKKRVLSLSARQDLEIQTQDRLPQAGEVSG